MHGTRVPYTSSHLAQSRALVQLFSTMRGRAAKNSASQSLALHQLPGQLLTKEDAESRHWYDAAPEWPDASEGGLRADLSSWRRVAGEALASASRAYDKSVGASKGDVTRAVEKEKTAGDRIAALTLYIQESPVYRLDELHTLLTITQKRRRGEKELAIEAMKDLLVNDLLPERRLVEFEDREFESGRKSISKRHLAYALFEAELKAVYREFLKILEECGNDSLAHFKQKTVKIMFELLVAKPENENALLAMLVNKLGDPDRKVSSIASYTLSQLIEKHHPQMRLVVVREVEQLLLRPNVTQKTQYYAVIFLNQIRFTEGDIQLARRLLKIYMDLFKTCLISEKKSGAKEQALVKRHTEFNKRRENPKKRRRAAAQKPSTETKESHLMGALLIGANRAYPYTKPEQDDTSYGGHYDALFTVAHAQSLGPATQALAFLFQVSQSQSTQSDRFYRALYSRLYDASRGGESKQAQFLNLLFKAMRADTNPCRLKAYMKRLLQAGLDGSSSFAGACAMVLSECFKGRHLGALKSYISLPEGGDDEENFVDADKENAQLDGEAISREKEGGKSTLESTNDLKLGNASEDSSAQDKEGEMVVRLNSNSARIYDAAKRDPQYAGAERSSLWELVTLCAHFHPSVSKFGRTLCVELKNVKYESDPLKDFSLIAFLDKFSYKKAKNRIAKSLYGKRSSRYRDNPVADSKEFQELAKDGNIAEDDKFFLRFFDENPDRVREEKMAGEGHGKDGEYIGNSEEEAFELAMREEMKRLGADVGFLSDGNKGFVEGIDDEDEDELKAFAEAFKDDMVASDDDEGEGDKTEAEQDAGEMSDEEVDTIVPLAAFEESEEDEKERDEEPPKKRNKRGNSDNPRSAFAAVEDYAEAIDLETKLGQPGNEEVTTDGRRFGSMLKQKRLKSTTRSRKRVARKR